MTRQSTLLLATLLLGVSACQKAEAPANTDAEKPAAAKPATVTENPPETKPELTPEPEQRTVASGLDLGMRFAAFEIVNCESGDKYCQVCKYGPAPKIMAVGTIDDEQFKKDLKDLDAIVAKYGEDKVKAFAVIAESKDGALVTPSNLEEMQAKAKALKEELELSMPVVVPAVEGEDGRNGVFEEHYQIKQSRTIMFADGQNEVKYSEVAPKDYAALDQAIKAVVG